MANIDNTGQAETTQSALQTVGQMTQHHQHINYSSQCPGMLASSVSIGQHRRFKYDTFGVSDQQLKDSEAWQREQEQRLAMLRSIEVDHRLHGYITVAPGETFMLTPQPTADCVVGRSTPSANQSVELRRLKDAERARQRRATMSAEELQRRREVQAEKARQRRAARSEEEQQRYRAIQAEQARQRRATLSAQERQRRRAAETERARVRRARHAENRGRGEQSESSSNTDDFSSPMDGDRKTDFSGTQDDASVASVASAASVAELAGAKVHQYLCPECGRTFSRPQSLSDHVRIKHSDIKPFHCEQCNKLFSYKKTYTNHMKMVHGIGSQFECQHCGKVLSTATTLAEHVRRHAEQSSPSPSSFLCAECGQAFRQRGSLVTHMQIKHLDMKHYNCQRCHKYFHYKVTYIKHMRRHAGLSSLQFECQICGKMLSSRNNLEEHVRNHTGDKRFKCMLCGLMCARAFTLQIHMNSHNGIKPYSCRFCDKRFANPGSRTMHVRRLHLRQRPYNCGDCGQSYRDKTYLKMHMVRVHSSRDSGAPVPVRCIPGAEKPFGCHYCDKIFTCRKHVRKHFWLSHAENEPALNT